VEATHSRQRKGFYGTAYFDRRRNGPRSRRADSGPIRPAAAMVVSAPAGLARTLNGLVPAKFTFTIYEEWK
jgi:hypothetical protein